MSHTQAYFDPKLSGSTINLPFDFIDDLGVSETISTKVVTCTVYSGTDVSPSSMINGAASSSGTIVTQSITGGTVGVMYQLLCTITTSLSQTITKSGFLAVVPDIV